jgi:hypothetical protein
MLRRMLVEQRESNADCNEIQLLRTGHMAATFTRHQSDVDSSADNDSEASRIVVHSSAGFGAAFSTGLSMSRSGAWAGL